MVPSHAGCLGWQAFAAALALAIPGAALGDTIYWDGTANALWSDATAWSTSSSATTPNPASPPGLADDVWFNISNVNGARTAYLNGNQAANSLTFRNTGSTALLSGAAANSGIQTLSLGGGGVAVNSGAGVTTLGNAANPIAFDLAASQTWANNSANSVSAYGSFAGAAASGTQSFTIGGSGNTTLSGSISDGTGGGSLGLVKTGAGTLTLATGTTGTNSSYTGGVWIQAGRLQLATAVTASQPAISSFDSLLGATPAAATPANIRIGDGATLGLDMTFGTGGTRSISANRGIQIDGTSQILFTGDMRGGRNFLYGGVISGAAAGSRLVLSSTGSSYAAANTAAFTATFSGNNTAAGGLLVTTSLTANVTPQLNRWAVVLSGSNNFGTGVVIDGVDGTPIVRSGTAGALGQNISANGVTINFGELSLASAATLGSNQTVTVNGFSGMLNTVDLGYSGAVPTNVQWKSAYGGVVGVGVGAFSQQLDMGTLGSSADGNYGRLFLGVGQFGNSSTQKTGTYSAAALGVGADSTYRLGGGGNNSQPGVLVFTNGVLTGANDVLVGRNTAWFNGAAEIRLNVANTYSGSTTIDQGVLTLTTATGAILNTSAITINTGGTLRLDNTSTANNTNRVADSTPLSVNGGTINFSNGAGAANYSESVGALTLGMGRATITTSAAAAAQTSTLTFASVTRNAGSTVVVNGTSVGADARNRIVFTDASGIKDLAGNAIASGEVIPWAVNGWSGTTNGFMTHQSGTLQAYTYTAAETKTGTSGWTNDGGSAFASTANVRWLPGVSGSLATITLPSGTTTINSLSYYGTGATVPNPANLTIPAATDRLVITSGAIYSTSSDTNRGLAIGGSGSLTAGVGVTEMIFSYGNATQIQVPIVDPDANTNMGVTITSNISGVSTSVQFQALNTYSGNTVITNNAVLRPTTANAIPFGSGKGDVYVYGMLGSNGAASNSAITVNGLWGNGMVMAITSGLTVGANNATSQFDGVFAQGNVSAGALAATPLTKIGSGTFTLTGFSPLATGSFSVREGVLAVTSVRDGGYASALGAFSTAASNLILAGGTTNATLRYVGQDPNSTNRLLTVGGTATGVTATIDASGSTPTATSGVDSRATIAFTGTGAIAYGTANQTRTLRFAGTNTGTNSFAPQINNNGTGVVSLVKDGVGLWVLSGSNSFSGGVNVSLGNLVVGNNNALGTGTATVGGGTLDVGSYTPSVASFAITSGSLTGSGKLTAATYGLGGGTVAGNLGGGTLTVTANSVLNGTSDATTVNLNAGALTLGSGGTRFTSNLVAVSGSAGAGLTLGGNETFGSLAGAANVSLGGNTLSVGSANTSTVYTGTLSGAGGLTKVGNGVFTLANVNTYSGATNISSGTVIASVAGAISGSSAITIGSVGSRGFLVIDDALTISSLTFTGSGGDIVNGSAGTATFSATSGTALITVLGGSNAFHANAAFDSPTLVNVSSGAYFTFHNNLSGTGSLTKSGVGTMELTGDSDPYSGSLFITAGRVNVGPGMSQLGTGTTTVSGGSVIDLNGQALTDRIVVLSGTILNAGGTSTTTTIQGPSTLSGTTTLLGTYNITNTGSARFESVVGNGSSIVTVNVNSGTGSGGQAVFANTVSNLATVTVNAGGAATFKDAVSGYVISHGASTFEGDVLYEAQVQSGGSATFAASTGTASTVTVAAGGVAEFRGTVGGTTTVSGSAVFTSSSGLTGSLTTTPSGVTTLDNLGSTIGGSIHNDGTLQVVRSSGNQTIGIGITGTGGLVKQGAGLLSLTGVNTFSGPTTISGGTLSVGNGGTSGSLAGNVVNNAALVFNRSDALTYAASISGSGSLTKLGGGKLTLTGNSTLAGITSVDEGILAVNGSLGSGALSVAIDATLMGSGTIGGAATVAGIHSPGNSPGIETFSSNLTYTGGSSQVVWELWGNTTSNSPLTYDQIVVNGNLDFAAATALSLAFGGTGVGSVDWNAAFWGTDQTWTLFDVAGTTSNFGNFTLTNDPSSWFDSIGLAFSASSRAENTFTVSQQGNDVLIHYTVVIPEPGSLALAGIGIVAAAYAYRRRRT